MNKLPKAIATVGEQAQHCLNRVEFFKTKSQASYANQAAKNYQEWAEMWADIDELLQELVMYRNACHPKINITWGTRLIEKTDEQP